MNNTLNISHHAFQISSLASKIYGIECTSKLIEDWRNSAHAVEFQTKMRLDLVEHLEYLLDLLKEDNYPELTRYTIKKKGDNK